MNKQSFYDLFDNALEANIPSLDYIPDFIDQEEERYFLQKIDEAVWDNTLKRQVQHYGYRYDYKARSVVSSSYLGALPKYLDELAQKLYIKNLFSKKPDQVIVNEYLPGQGIAPHIDCESCFGNEIASLSLGSGAVMQFTNLDENQEIYLENRSLILLQDDARYKWKHSIPARKSDKIFGKSVSRSRRISLTFRNII